MAKNRKLTCSYLYSDGTLAETFDEMRNGVLIGETVDITYGYCDVRVHADYSSSRRSYYYNPEEMPAGRIVIHRGDETFVGMARGGKVVGIAPSIDGGSPHSQALGLSVQHVKLTTMRGEKLSWCDCTGVISSLFSVQADGQKLDEGLRTGCSIWDRCRVGKVKDLRKKEVAA